MIDTTKIKTPAEVKLIFLNELSNYVDVYFTKFDRWNEETLYFPSYSIRKSDNELWEEARTSLKSTDFFVIAGILLILFRKNKSILSNCIGIDDNEILREIRNTAILEYEYQKIDEYLSQQ